MLCKGQSKLYNSIKKHGWEAHKFEVIFELRDDISPEMLTYWEQFFMDYYRAEGYELMNLRDAGNKGRLSEETKNKIREYHLLNSPLRGKKASTKTIEASANRCSKKGKESIGFRGYINAYKDGNFVGVFDGVVDAMIKLNANNVSSVLSGKRKTSAGYTFERLKK